LCQFRHECGNDTVFSYRSRKWFLCSRRNVSFFFRRDKPRIRYTSRLACSVKCRLSFFRSTDIWSYRYSNARRGRIWFLVTACQDWERRTAFSPRRNGSRRHPRRRNAVLSANEASRSRATCCIWKYKIALVPIIIADWYRFQDYLTLTTRSDCWIDRQDDENNKNLNI